mmetsp:Transcript_1873/g.4150  ORF Transcript_1873/g.4150 Transcript_1873/m.4150 type:complete len:240 (-) Transcript_1873:9-728(-)
MADVAPNSTNIFPSTRDRTLSTSAMRDADVATEGSTHPYSAHLETCAFISSPATRTWPPVSASRWGDAIAYLASDATGGPSPPTVSVSHGRSSTAPSVSTVSFAGTRFSSSTTTTNDEFMASNPASAILSAPSDGADAMISPNRRRSSTYPVLHSDLEVRSTSAMRDSASDRRAGEIASSVSASAPSVAMRERSAAVHIDLFVSVVDGLPVRASTSGHSIPPRGTAGIVRVEFSEMREE